MLNSPDIPSQLSQLGEKFTMKQFNSDVCSSRFVISGMTIKKIILLLTVTDFCLFAARLVNHSHKENLKKQHTVQLQSHIRCMIQCQRQH